MVSATIVPGLVWTRELHDLWSAARADGTPTGTVVRSDQYKVMSYDGSVTGVHHSLDAAQSELEALERRLHVGR